MQVGAIWARRLNALERGGAPDNDHGAVYASAIAAGLQVCRLHAPVPFVI